MGKTRTLVILGAGVGGTPLAHHVLRFTSPKVPDLRVVLVTPNTDFFWNLGSPRSVVSTEFTDKIFEPLAPHFAKYGDKVELVYGKASALQPEKNTVLVALNDGGSRSIEYDTLVIATGSSARDGMPWKSLGSTAETKKALKDIAAKVDVARTIVVAGGGLSGVEIVGELGDLAAVDSSKEVYYVIEDKLPLGAPVKDNVREVVNSALVKNKVKIISNSKVVGATTEGSKTVIEIGPANAAGKKQTITADLYLPAFGVVPNTDFVPASLKAADGRLKQTTKLRVEGLTNVFVMGDAGNLELPKAMGVDAQTHHLGKVLGAYFTAGTEPEEYKPNDKFMFGVSMGKDSGTGQMMGMKIFGLMIWYMKCRYMGTNYYTDIVKGTRTITGNMKG